MRPFGQSILGSENKNVIERTLDIESYLPISQREVWRPREGNCFLHCCLEEAGLDLVSESSTGSLVITAVRVGLVKPVSGQLFHCSEPH